MDLSGVANMRKEIAGGAGGRENAGREGDTEQSGVFADYSSMEAMEQISSSIVENNLTDFKNYLEDSDSEIQNYLGENGIVCTYDINFSVYSYDEDGQLINSDDDLGCLLYTSVTGLESGADDYITKPFSLMVLRARAGVQLRREAERGTVFELGDFYFDFQRMIFRAGGRARCV